jgi:hypothetical protein
MAGRQATNPQVVSQGAATTRTIAVATVTTGPETVATAEPVQVVVGTATRTTGATVGRTTAAERAVVPGTVTVRVAAMAVAEAAMGTV